MAANLCNHAVAINILVSTSCQVDLQRFASLEMESMGHIQHSTAIAGASLQFVGDLKFHQSEPLVHKGADRRFNVGILCQYSTYFYIMSLIHSRLTAGPFLTVNG